MKLNLTESAISAATKKAADTRVRIELPDPARRGLRLRITPAGSRSWVLGCRDSLGALRRFPLGDHPAMGIAEARKASDAMRARINAGADPIAEARQKRLTGKEARDGINTFGELIELYGTKRGAELKSWTECERRIRSVFARQIKRPLAGLRLADLQMTADAWKSPQSAAAAVRYLRPILKWAAAPGRSYVTRDLADISPPTTVSRRDRVLSRDELARLLPALRASDRPYAAAMRFLLHTLTRREEAGAARWRDIDFTSATWTIGQTKNGQPHMVPLSRQALDLLHAIRPENPSPDALIFATGSGKSLANWDKETKIIQAISSTEGWTRHDLRRTGATILGNLGELPDIIEAALNHTSIRSTLAATYNRSRYRPQVAVALQRLGDALDGIETGSAAVVPMRRA